MEGSPTTAAAAKRITHTQSAPTQTSPTAPPDPPARPRRNTPSPTSLHQMVRQVCEAVGETWRNSLKQHIQSSMAALGPAPQPLHAGPRPPQVYFCFEQVHTLQADLGSPGMCSTASPCRSPTAPGFTTDSNNCTRGNQSIAALINLEALRQSMRALERPGYTSVFQHLHTRACAHQFMAALVNLKSIIWGVVGATAAAPSCLATFVL